MSMDLFPVKLNLTCRGKNQNLYKNKRKHAYARARARERERERERRKMGKSIHLVSVFSGPFKGSLLLSSRARSIDL